MKRSRPIVGWAHVGGVCLALILALLGIGRPRHSAVRPSAPNPVAAQPNPAADSGRLVSRPLYPYSVIPGGVESGPELKYELAHDPVAASHYSDFDVAKTRVIRLDHDEFMYVSYRMANRIFWTNKKLKIPSGETLLTDGTHLARTRCGNRLCDFFMQPTSPEQPAPQALELPAAPELVAILTPPFNFPPTTPLAPTPAPVTPPSTPPILIPPVYYPPIGGGGPTPSTPPVNIPEPGVVELLAIGFSVVGAGRWIIVRRKRKP